MGESNVNLAALIGSRICHDLISPIGAISNGLELLDMAGAMHGPELELISGSVGNAGARIRFFRIAYGEAADKSVGSTEVSELLDALGHSSRLKAHWQPTAPKPRKEVKLAFLALQCCESAMPLGGHVEIDCEDGQWSITGTADRVTIDPDLWRGLTSGTAPACITPALVQFALLPEAVAAAGRRLRVDTTSTRVSIRF